MIIDYTKGTFITNNKTGCKFITVDAYRNHCLFMKKWDSNTFQVKTKNLILD